MAQDQLTRLAQQIAAMLAAIVVKRHSGQIEEARQDLEALCLQTVGVALETVNQLSPDELARLLHDSAGIRSFRSVMLAEMLIQDAEILETLGSTREAIPNNLHAFCLLSDSYMSLSREDQAIYKPKLDTLAAKLERFPPTPYTTERVSVYRAHANQ